MRFLTFICLHWGDDLKLLKNKKGFTLVEMIIVLAVAAIVLTPFSFIMTSGMKNEIKVQERIDADQTTQQTFIVLNEKVRHRGFDSVVVLPSHLGLTNVLWIDDKIFYHDTVNNEYVYQDYNASTLQTSTKVVLNTYVSGATHTMVLFSDTIPASEHTNYTSDELNEKIRLEIAFTIDSYGDGSVVETYNYINARRD